MIRLKLVTGSRVKSIRCICPVLIANLPVFTLKESMRKAPHAADNQLQANYGFREDRLKTPVLGEALSSLASAAFSAERKRVLPGTVIRLKRPLLTAV